MTLQSASPPPPSDGMALPAPPLASPSADPNAPIASGSSPDGLSISALNATYYSSFPVGVPYAAYGTTKVIGADRGMGVLTTSNLTRGIRFMVYVTRMYPPGIYGSATGGLRPNYSLQSNFFVNGSGQGGEGLYWTQFGTYFMYDGMTGNQDYFVASPYLEWWWPAFSQTGFASFSGYPEYESHVSIARIGPGSPYMVEGWEFTGNNGSGDYVNVTLMARGYIESFGNGTPAPNGFRYLTVWSNATYSFGGNGTVNPSFELRPASDTADQGVGIVGAGNHQAVWGNYTAYMVVEEFMNGSFVLPQVSSVVGNISGEQAVGTRGGMVVNQSFNPFGLPAYTPYAYITNSSGRGNGMGAAYLPTVVQGYVFPANAAISAYAMGADRYLAVSREGNAFYVTSIGYQFTSLVLNFSATGYKNYSITYYPSAVNVSVGVELHNPFVSLRPLSGNVVYGFVELPFPYLAYLMDTYIHANGGLLPNATFMNSTVTAWREWFPLSISTDGNAANLSWYIPSLLHEYASVIYNFTRQYPNPWDRYYYGNITALYVDSPVYLPYSFVAGANASIAVRSPLLNQSFAVPLPDSEFNITPSMFVFQVPVTITSTSPWYLDPYPIGGVVWDGRNVWEGDSLQASFTFPYSMNSSGGSFRILSHPSLYLNNTNAAGMTFLASVDVYSYNGLRDENLTVAVQSFNYSVAALVSHTGAERFPLRVTAELGGTPNILYPGVAVMSAAVLAIMFYSRRKHVREVKG
ncbi:MAG: hypothetical protein ACP5O1_11120 [Phycisphaerae bacterium]